MRWCHTDLGAVAYSWPRWIQEDLRFANLSEAKRFTGEDALMAELVTKSGWSIKHLHGQCLFDQGPNPHMCARHGGVLLGLAGSHRVLLSASPFSIAVARPVLRLCSFARVHAAL